MSNTTFTAYTKTKCNADHDHSIYDCYGYTTPPPNTTSGPGTDTSGVLAMGQLGHYMYPVPKSGTNKSEDEDYSSLKVDSGASLVVYDYRNNSGCLKYFRGGDVVTYLDGSDGSDTPTKSISLNNDGTINTDYGNGGSGSGGWDRSIRSWRLTMWQILDPEAITNGFLKKYTPYKYGTGSIEGVDNGNGNFSQATPTSATSVDNQTFPAYPNNANNYLDIRYGSSRFRVFWPFFMQTNNVMKVWLEVENQNTADNDVAFVYYEIDLTTGQLQGNLIINYHQQSAPALSDWLIGVTDGLINYGGDAVQMMTDVALESFCLGAGTYVINKAISVGATLLTVGVNHINDLIAKISNQWQDSYIDASQVMFPSVVVHAIVRSATMILNKQSYDQGGSTALLSLDLDAFPASCEAGAWNYEYDNPSVNISISTQSNGDLPYRIYAPAFSGTFGKSGIFCSCRIQAENSDDDATVDNNLALSAIFDPSGNIFCLNAIVGVNQDGPETRTTGLVTVNGNGELVSITTDINGVQTTVTNEDSSITTILEYFNSLLASICASDDDAYLVNLPQACNIAIQAMQNNIVGIPTS